MPALPQTISKSTFNTSSQDDSTTLRNATELLGRILVVALFLTSGVGKITAYTATIGYMAAVGVPGALLPLAIVTEVLGALAIVLSWKTRIVSILLAGFTLLTGILFHGNFADQTPMVMFLKNVSIEGAFLLMAANGAGQYSADSRKVK
jgi:putative oxidoreductase